LISNANKLANLATDKSKNLEGELSPIILSILNNLDVNKNINHISDFTNNFLKILSNRMENPQEIWGIPTGLKLLDDLTGGFQKSEFTIVSGSPGVGKSMLVNQIAINMANYHHPGIVISLEMSGYALIRRMLSWETKVTSKKMNTGFIDEKEFITINNGIQQLNKLPLFISDDSTWTTMSLRVELNKMKINNNIDFVIIDYMSLLKDNIELSENDRTSMISTSLKAIAKDLDISLIAVQSMNKDGMRGNLGMSNLRGSGQVAYTADTIIQMKKGKEENLVDVYIIKGRELTGKSYFKLEKSDKYPGFVDYMKNTEPVF
jgi:replicative DNA helicase